MKPAHIQQLAATIFELMESKGMLDNCTTCCHWHETKEICTKFNVRPPVTIILHGCEHHQVIPF